MAEGVDSSREAVGRIDAGAIVNSEEKSADDKFNASIESLDLNSSSDLSDCGGPVYDLGDLSCLPPEIIQKVMVHLDARFLLTCLSCVCKTFYQLVNDKTTWRLRVAKLSDKNYPIFQDDSFNWPFACVQREEFHHHWCNTKESMDHFVLKEAHYATVDCVHLIQSGRYCFTGARDRAIQMWDLTKLDAKQPDESVGDAKISSIIAHKGWIWHLSSNQDKLCSSSWDCHMKIWDLGTEFTELHDIKGPSAFLCSVFSNDILLAGSYDKTIYAYDPRAGYQCITTWKHHKGPVLCLAADDMYMISASEDQYVRIVDRRSGKVFIEKKFRSFPMSLSYGHNQLWTGHKNGELRVTHPNGGLFNVVNTYDPAHNGRLTGIVHNLGGLYTCATDRTIKIHAPTDPIDTIKTLTDHQADVTAITLQNDVLASACGDLSVGIWRPKEWNG